MAKEYPPLGEESTKLSIPVQIVGYSLSREVEALGEEGGVIKKFRVIEGTGRAFLDLKLERGEIVRVQLSPEDFENYINPLIDRRPAGPVLKDCDGVQIKVNDRVRLLRPTDGVAEGEYCTVDRLYPDGTVSLFWMEGYDTVRVPAQDVLVRL